MNERIKELAAQATTCEKGPPVLNGYDSYNSEIILFDKEKFAELIVRECGKICDGVQEKYGQYTFTARVCKEEIKEHFGVE